MANKKIIRKSNRVLNLFDIGGLIKNTTSGLNTIGTLLNTGIKNAQLSNTTNIENEIEKSQARVVQANNNDELMREWGSYSPMENINWKDIRGGSTAGRISNTVGALASGATAGSQIGGPIGSVVGATLGLGSSIAGWITGDKKAKRKANTLNEQINALNEKNLLSLENKAMNIDIQNDLNALANFSAYGGKIHIKKENRGKFTDYCGGNVTSECIAKGKRSSNPAVRKRAIFADNARKWKHSFGGYLYDDGGNLYASIPNIGQHGGNFSNGVTIIGNGGTHEENPMEGVPMGIAPDGTPNLVEQGEVKFNNYIFSNRLFATKELLELYNLPSTYVNHSFADIAERLSKESSERPNDPISKRGLLNSMTRLQQAQEQIRAEKQSRKYAKGGHIFDKGGDIDDPYYGSLDQALEDAELAFYQKKDPSIVPDINSKDKFSWDPSLLRYTPVVGAGLGVISDLIGLTNKPDYSSADLIGNVADNLTPIEVTTLGNYLTYKPFDRNYYINKLNAEAGATRRAIVGQSGGNRATAVAGLLAADYNALGKMGDLARQAEEYNMAQRERVEAFNRGTNQFNAELALKAATANQRNDELGLKARITQAQLRDQADTRASASRTANLTNLFDSLGEIGREEFSRNMIQSNPSLYYSIDREGKLGYKNGYKTKKAKDGGYLTIKKRK